MKNKKRIRICIDCGREDLVFNRQIGRCRKCADVLLAIQKKEYSIKHRLEHSKLCLHCNTMFYNKEKDTIYCSKKCAYDAKRITRTCKECDSDFVAQVGKISGKSNSRANFCCITCYRKWQCRTEKSENRNHDWVLLSRNIIEKQPYCSFCGTTKRLNCHHIIPYRLTKDDLRKNIMVLCKRCHSNVECITRDMEKHFSDKLDMMQTLLRTSMLEKLMVVSTVVSNIIEERKNENKRY